MENIGMLENDPGSITRRRRSDYTPDHTVASIGKRYRAAERAVHKWRTTFPELPREHRERLAALLLAEDERPGGAE